MPAGGCSLQRSAINSNITLRQWASVGAIQKNFRMFRPQFVDGPGYHSTTSHPQALNSNPGPCAAGETSKPSGSDEDVASWISWFCSLKGNEFFCEVSACYTLCPDHHTLCSRVCVCTVDRPLPLARR